MLRICSWCQIVIGWNGKSKGETHGICESCLQEYFPQEADLVFQNINSKSSTSYRAMVGETAL